VLAPWKRLTDHVATVVRRLGAIDLYGCLMGGGAAMLHRLPVERLSDHGATVVRPWNN
jgi:hypothetical protein